MWWEQTITLGRRGVRMPRKEVREFEIKCSGCGSIVCYSTLDHQRIRLDWIDCDCEEEVTE